MTMSEQAARDREIEPLLNHLTYEIRVLMRLRPHLVRLWQAPDPEDAILYVAVLESILVHFRCLTEFLIGRPDLKRGKRKRPESDIGANLLIPDWDDRLAATAPTDVTKLDEFVRQVDGAVVHLSKRRIQPDTQIEVFVPYINLMYRGLFGFVAELRDTGSSIAEPLLGALNDGGGPWNVGPSTPAA
jgi:hypothetical protein